MTVKLLTEHYFEFLSLKGGCIGSDSTLVKMPHCWKSHVAAQIISTLILLLPLIQEGLLSVTSERMCTKHWLTELPQEENGVVR